MYITHTHTHTHIHIYIYIWKRTKSSREHLLKVSTSSLVYGDALLSTRGKGLTKDMKKAVRSRNLICDWWQPLGVCASVSFLLALPWTLPMLKLVFLFDLLLLRNSSPESVLLLLLLSHFSCVRLCVTPQTAAHQAPPSLRFSRQEFPGEIAISFSNAGKWKVKVKSLSRVQLFVTPWTAAYQAPPSMGFSRQEY